MTALKPTTPTAADCDVEKAASECAFVAAASHKGLRNFDDPDNIARCFQAQAEALEQARVALEPFGDIDGEGDEDFPDDEIVTMEFGRTTTFVNKLGDLRKARTALARIAALTGRG